MYVVRAALRVAATLALAVAVATPLTGPGGPLAFADVALTQPVLTISGSVDGLVPGQPGRLLLTLANAGDRAVDVRTLTARVTATPVGCSAAALTIDGWHGRLHVPSGGTAVQALPVRLTPAAPGCGGATWHLRYAST